MLSATLVRDLYTRILLTRLIDDLICQLHERGQSGFGASCCGYEAAQVGSATCIEVGTDFTLPCERDLGVVLTIGMTPYEVFRTALLAQRQQGAMQRDTGHNQPVLSEGHPVEQHWGYSKHNMVTGSASGATHILHAAGIAFAAKLRKAAVVTVVYCGDSATREADFREGIEFAALHQLPLICICEQSGLSSEPLSHSLHFPAGLTCECLDGADVVSVHLAMQTALRHAREGNGPVFLELRVHCLERGGEINERHDPLLRCQRYLEEQGVWDEMWAERLHSRLEGEVGQAMRDAERDVGGIE